MGKEFSLLQNATTCRAVKDLGASHTFVRTSSIGLLPSALKDESCGWRERKEMLQRVHFGLWEGQACVGHWDTWRGKYQEVGQEDARDKNLTFERLSKAGPTQS